MRLAIILPEKEDTEYKYKGADIKPMHTDLNLKYEDADLLVGMHRQGTKFEFYLDGTIGNNKVKANVSETYDILCSYGESAATYIANRLNSDLLSMHGCVLSDKRLGTRLEDLLKKFGFKSS